MLILGSLLSSDPLRFLLVDFLKVFFCLLYVLTFSLEASPKDRLNKRWLLIDLSPSGIPL